MNTPGQFFNLVITYPDFVSWNVLNMKHLLLILNIFINGKYYTRNWNVDLKVKTGLIYGKFGILKIRIFTTFTCRKFR